MKRIRRYLRSTRMFPATEIATRATVSRCRAKFSNTEEKVGPRFEPPKIIGEKAAKGEFFA